MSGQDANSKDMLSRIHEQRVKDQNNDSTQTGAFPMVKAKKRISLDAKVTRTRPAFWSRYCAPCLASAM